MSYWLFCRRCSLCRGVANTAMHVTRYRIFTDPSDELFP